MNEGVERVYLRSWGQIKGKFGRGWFTLFRVDQGFIFFLLLFLGLERECFCRVQGSAHCAESVEKEAGGGAALPGVSSSMLPQHCPHQDPSFSAWCAQLGHFQPHLPVPDLCISPLSTYLG